MFFTARLSKWWILVNLEPSDGFKHTLESLFLFFWKDKINNFLFGTCSEIFNGFAQLSKMCIFVKLGLPMTLQTHTRVAFHFLRHIK